MTRVAAIQMTSGADVARNLANASVLLREAQARGRERRRAAREFRVHGTQRGRQARDQRSAERRVRSSQFLAATAQRTRALDRGRHDPDAAARRTARRCRVPRLRRRRVAPWRATTRSTCSTSTFPAQRESYRESSSVRPGVEPVVVDTPAGRLGLAVCYDLRFPGTFPRAPVARRGLVLPALGLHGAHRPRALGTPVARPGHRKSLLHGGSGPVRLPRKRPRNARRFDDHRPLGPYPGPIAARNRRSHGRIGLRTAARSAAEFSCRLPPPACAANDDPNKDIMKPNIPPPMFAPQPAALAAALGQREPLDVARTALLGPRRTRRESRRQRAGRRHGSCGRLCRHLFPVDA